MRFLIQKRVSKYYTKGFPFCAYIHTVIFMNLSQSCFHLNFLSTEMVKFAAKHSAVTRKTTTNSKNIKVTVPSHESLETMEARSGQN